MTRPRWEYMQTNTLWPKMAGEVSKMDEEWHALEIGHNGWELVTVVRTPSGTLTAFFKRQVIPPPPEEDPVVIVKGEPGVTLTATPIGGRLNIKRTKTKS